MPKLYQPSVACPQCQYPNDEGFRFCQNCGYLRRTLAQVKDSGYKLKFGIDEGKIAHRVKELCQARSSTRYAKQKTALELEFSQFLSCLSSPKDLSTALPHDVVSFLVWKDQAGRTVIHNPTCSFVGQSKQSQCGCPRRLAFGTVDSLIGKLRAVFAENGRGVEWHSLLGVGNPAADRAVKNYLSTIREEQLKAQVTPRQAEPVVLSDLETLSRFIHSKLAAPILDPVEIFVLARDQAVFKALFFSADRAADLLGILSPTILRFPDDSGFLFNQVWTKSLRSGDSNVFAFKRGSNRLVCPVLGIELYVKICNALKINVASGYLFRSVSKNGAISACALEPPAIQARLDAYVKQLQGLLSGARFTLHGFRSGAAISMALADVSLDDIMDHVGWKSSRTALHYIKLKQVLNPAGPAAKLANLDINLGKDYKTVNELNGFVMAFPE